MRLNKGSLFDPRFTREMGKVKRAGMTSSVLVRRRKLESDPEKAVWDSAQGKYIGSDFRTLWTGPARVQPGVDWRSKGYEFGDTTTVFQACRIDIPFVDGVWDSQVPEDQHFFNDEDQIIVLHNFFPNLDPLKRFAFVVRNPLMGGNASSMSTLCDVELKGGIDR